ncbi:ATP-binding cassette domain-containing protein [Candidatus Parcubacteria bacterium]|nr:ATP-binding cassette domain-containing protein [Candidatus Parcubacteria bacterium]
MTATKDLKIALFLGYKSIVNGHKSAIALMIFILSLAFVNLVFVASILSNHEKTLFRLQRLGYVFQEYALIFELTALENVLLPAFALNGSQQGYKKKAIDMLDRVGLKKRVNHHPQELSGGEQQRVAIARALINDPKILFADEPMANLDTNSSRQILELFQKLNKELGQTIVMVTHEPDDQKYVDRVIWIKDGLIEKII